MSFLFVVSPLSVRVLWKIRGSGNLNPKPGAVGMMSLGKSQREEEPLDDQQADRGDGPMLVLVSSVAKYVRRRRRRGK